MIHEHHGQGVSQIPNAAPLGPSAPLIRQLKGTISSFSPSEASNTPDVEPRGAVETNWCLPKMDEEPSRKVKCKG